MSRFGMGFIRAAGAVQTPIAIASVSAWSGTMSLNGGIAAIRDGVTSQTLAASARSSQANGVKATAVVDWGAGVTKLLSQLKLHAPSDGTMFDGGTGTISIIGSTDNFVASNVTLFTATSIAEPGAGGFYLVERASIVTTTAYRYHKVEFTASGGKTACAEAAMWEDI